MSEETKAKLDELEETLKAMDNVQPLDLVEPSEEEQPQGNEAPAPEPKPEGEAEGNTPAKPDAKPGESHPEQAQEPEKKEEDLLESEVENPQAEHFRKLREVAKEFKQKTLQLQQELEQLKSKPQEPAKVEATQPDKPKVMPDQLVQIVAKARNQELDGVDMGQVMKDALVVMKEEFTPLQINQIVEKASRGEYGKYSEDIQLFMQEAIPHIMVAQQAREMEVRQERQEVQERQARYKQEADASLARVFEKAPELKDEKSPVRVAVNNWLAENIGVFNQQGVAEKTGPMAWVLQHPSWPEMVLPLALASVKAQGTRIVSAPFAEASGSRGGPQSPVQTGKPKIKALEDTLRNMGQVSLT